MDSYTAFNEKELKFRLDAFAPGMSDHLTPIKYEAISPFMFCFMFRTTGGGRKDYFFVLFSFDHLPPGVKVRQLIEKWAHATVHEFITPEKPSHYPLMHDDVKLSPESIYEYGGNPYLSMLARIDQPTDGSYWSSYVALYPGEDLADKIIDWPRDEQEKIVEFWLGSGWALHQYDAIHRDPLNALNNVSEHTIDTPLMRNDTDTMMTFYRSDYLGNDWHLHKGLPW